MSVNVLSFFLYIQACVGPVSSVLSAHVGFAVSFRTYDTRSSSLVRLELRTAAASGGGGAIGSGCGSGVVGCGGCRIVSNGDDSSFVDWRGCGVIGSGGGSGVVEGSGRGVVGNGGISGVRVRVRSLSAVVA